MSLVKFKNNIDINITINGGMILFSLFNKKDKEKTCNEEVGILDIRNNYIYTRDGNVIAGIKIYSINTQLLTDREKDIIIKRYGLFNTKEKTQKEIAKEFGISRSYVSRIEKRALTKILREFIRNKKYQDN